MPFIFVENEKEVMDFLRNLPGVIGLKLLDDIEWTRVKMEERGVSTLSETPLENDSLQAQMRLENHVAILFDNNQEPLIEGNIESLVVKDQNDRICGYEVNDEEKLQELKKRDDLVWISSNFLLETDAKEIRFVLLPVPLERMKEIGIDNALVMFPCTTAEILIRRICGFPFKDKTSAIVVSFD